VMQRLLESDAVRHRKLMRDDRLELGLTLGSSAGELYTRSFLFGLQAQTYLSDSFGLGGFVFYALNMDSSLAERVRSLRPTRVNDETFARVNFGASLETMLVPAFGKASLLGAMTARYDLNLILGVGALQQSGAGELEQLAIAPVIGLGTRLFLSDTLAVNVGLRDYIYKRAQNAILLKGDEGVTYVASPRWQHQFFLTATFSFFTGKPQTSL
jgi:outer membrane beta-barrel protein